MIRFSHMPYARPDPDRIREDYEALTRRLQQAEDFSQAEAAFLEMERFSAHLDTLSSLAYIRNSIDTRDLFYDGEMAFWNGTSPRIREYARNWTLAMLNSPFRPDFEEKYGTLWSLNAQMELKAFSPVIIEDLQRENELVQAYNRLMASSRVEFEGRICNQAQLGRYRTDRDDARRLAAWKASGGWYKENQQELDRIYDELVQVRTAMGRRLGYDSYIPLGYLNMCRNCYGREDVERFRAAVVRYLVPLADSIRREQAERLGVAYPLSFSDEALLFRSGNPRPVGTPEDIVDTGRRFYEALSPETAEFFHTMLDMGTMDLLAREGKAVGGYCASLRDYRMAFIFANFNGTQHDVEVITHEAGHAFADWLNMDRIPGSYACPTMEACEVHSMSMEFLAWPWAEEFFGEDAPRFRYSHLAGALTFIPYGTMVDHFQHLMYERPELTPGQRHGVWRELLGTYMPWLRLDGEIPFFSEGEGWQRQHHIYTSPFYYIDYCLAQTVALQIWALLQKDPALAWETYMAYTRQGGSRVFTDLLSHAGLESPFEEECLRKVSAAAKAWLDRCDMSALR